MNFQGIDLSSDTVTKPSMAMKEAMLAAEVGDEQRAEDPTTRQLETMIAEILGLDDAVFVPSATMANQIAIQTLCPPGDIVVAAHDAHILIAESGGPALHARVMTHPIMAEKGMFSANDLRKICALQLPIPAHPMHRLLVIDNTTNLAGGEVWEQNNLAETLKVADEFGLKKHLDGSRLFNASVKSGRSPKELATGFDTVTICLSKGLGCPVGALLAFKNENRVIIHKLKKQMGGAMRQTGILAAAGVYALKHNITRLKDDHDHAAALAKILAKIPEITVRNPYPATNIVIFDWNSPSMRVEEFQDWTAQQGVRFSRIAKSTLRAVTHLDIRRADIEKVGAILAKLPKGQ